MNIRIISLLIFFAISKTSVGLGCEVDDTQIFKQGDFLVQNYSRGESNFEVFFQKHPDPTSDPILQLVLDQITMSFNEDQTPNKIEFSWENLSNAGQRYAQANLKSASQKQNTLRIYRHAYDEVKKRHQENPFDGVYIEGTPNEVQNRLNTVRAVSYYVNELRKGGPGYVEYLEDFALYVLGPDLYFVYKETLARQKRLSSFPIVAAEDHLSNNNYLNNRTQCERVIRAVRGTNHYTEDTELSILQRNSQVSKQIGIIEQEATGSEIKINHTTYETAKTELIEALSSNQSGVASLRSQFPSRAFTLGNKRFLQQIFNDSCDNVMNSQRDKFVVRSMINSRPGNYLMFRGSSHQRKLEHEFNEMCRGSSVNTVDSNRSWNEHVSSQAIP